MTDKLQVYGIPNCDTVKKSKKWLEQANVLYEFIDYREQPISTKSLQNWANLIGWEKLFNKRSTTFRQLSPAQKEGLNEQNALALMGEHPTLIKRPVFVRKASVLTGFKAAELEAWLS